MSRVMTFIVALCSRSGVYRVGFWRSGRKDIRFFTIGTCFFAATILNEKKCQYEITTATIIAIVDRRAGRLDSHLDGCSWLWLVGVVLDVETRNWRKNWFNRTTNPRLELGLAHVWEVRTGARLSWKALATGEAICSSGAPPSRSP